MDTQNKKKKVNKNWCHSSDNFLFFWVLPTHTHHTTTHHMADIAAEDYSDLSDTGDMEDTTTTPDPQMTAQHVAFRNQLFSEMQTPGYEFGTPKALVTPAMTMGSFLKGYYPNPREAKTRFGVVAQPWLVFRVSFDDEHKNESHHNTRRTRERDSDSIFIYPVTIPAGAILKVSLFTINEEPKKTSRSVQTNMMCLHLSAGVKLMRSSNKTTSIWSSVHATPDQPFIGPGECVLAQGRKAYEESPTTAQHDLLKTCVDGTLLINRAHAFSESSRTTATDETTFNTHGMGICPDWEHDVVYKLRGKGVPREIIDTVFRSAFAKLVE
jgi:hypothetical protein